MINIRIVVNDISLEQKITQYCIILFTTIPRTIPGKFLWSGCMFLPKKVYSKIFLIFWGRNSWITFKQHCDELGTGCQNVKLDVVFHLRDKQQETIISLKIFHLLLGGALLNMLQSKIRSTSTQKNIYSLLTPLQMKIILMRCHFQWCRRLFTWCNKANHCWDDLMFWIVFSSDFPFYPGIPFYPTFPYFNNDFKMQIFPNKLVITIKIVFEYNYVF